MTGRMKRPTEPGVVPLKFATGLLFGFVSGHDFSRAANRSKSSGLQPLRAFFESLLEKFA